MSAEITLTTTRPEAPQADFAFEIDFKRGEGSPSREGRHGPRLGTKALMCSPEMPPLRG
jgi:hypothetical protein